MSLTIGPRYNVEIFADFQLLDLINLEGVKPIQNTSSFKIPRNPLSIFLTNQELDGTQLQRTRKSYPNTVLISKPELDEANLSSTTDEIQKLLLRYTENPWDVEFNQDELVIHRGNKTVTLGPDEGILFLNLGGTKRVRSVPINKLLNIQRPLRPISIVDSLKSLESKLRTISLYINIEPNACFIYGRLLNP